MSTSIRRTGRPRSARADRAILGATRTALVELGWDRLTMSDVAARAGVARTTLYRRWAGKNELILDAVAALFDGEPELPDHGSLRADVEGVVLRFATLLRRPEVRVGLLAVIAETARDDALREGLRTALVDRQKRWVMLGRARAQDRGELSHDAVGTEGEARAARVVDLIFDVIAGSVVHRVVVSDAPIDGCWAREFTDLLVNGLVSADVSAPDTRLPTVSPDGEIRAWPPSGATSATDGASDATTHPWAPPGTPSVTHPTPPP